ncbi:MAG: O-antigen ligase family protein, partial [Patescibacteria group bacterium]
MKYFKKAGEFLLYLLVFLLPLQTRLIIRPGIVNAGYLEYGTIGLYITDIILVTLLSVLAISLLWPKTRNFLSLNLFPTKVKNDYALIALVVLELLVFVSIFFATYKLLAVYKYLLFLSGLIIFLLISRGEFFNRLRLIYIFLASIFLQSVLALYQFITQSTFASKLLGLSLHDPAVPGVSVVEFYNRQGLLVRWLRSYGGLDHPNILGGVLAIGIILIVGLLVNRKKWQIAQKSRRLFVIVNYSLLLFFALALVLTFSHAAYLAASLGVIVLLIASAFGHFRDRISFKSLDSRLLVGFSVLFVIVCIAFFSSLEIRLFSASRLGRMSNCERVAGYSDAFKSIVSDPVSGSGVGNYYLSLYSRNSHAQSYFYQPVHNVFLLVASEIGIPGLLFFILFLGLIIWGKLINFRNNGLPLALILACLIIAMVDHWFWSLHFGIFFFWLVLGIATWEFNES